MEPVTLSDDRVLLSLPTTADVDAITTACQDPEIAAWVTVPRPYRRADAEGFVEGVVPQGWRSGDALSWAVRPAPRPPLPEPATGRPGEGPGPLWGMIGLHAITAGSAEIGYWVAPWARGRGVAGAATRLVLDWAFSPAGLGLVRVKWLAYVGNWPSRRVAWQAGFRVEGTIRREVVQRGVRRDSWVATLQPEDPRSPAEPWPDDAPPDGRAVLPPTGIHERMQP